MYLCCAFCGYVFHSVANRPSRRIWPVSSRTSGMLLLLVPREHINLLSMGRRLRFTGRYLRRGDEWSVHVQKSLVQGCASSCHGLGVTS